MIRGDLRAPLRLKDRSAPAHQALRVSVCLLAALSLASFGTLSAPLLPPAIFAAIALAVAHYTLTYYPHGEFGLCNAITLTRAAIVAFLIGALFDPAFSVWLFFELSVVAFALDAVDGWLARRSGLTSGVGARFDMETDSGLAAVLAVWILMEGTAGPEVLVLGFARYWFLAAMVALPALRAELPPSFRRKAVCVFQIGTLIALILPVTPPSVALPAAMIAAMLVIWSFAIDIVWLLRRGA